MHRGIRKFAVKLLLGRRREEVFDIVRIRGKTYLIRLYLYESAEETIAKMEKALQEQGLKL
ncbi:MAG: hypothetical protein HFH11_11805 [Dorea sp.]|jgi:hypothetical protein|nr:hypothetical protein [Dorea sp.]